MTHKKLGLLSHLFMKPFLHFQLLAVILCLISAASYATQAEDDLMFNDSPLNESLDVPDWFSLSFLDLNESLEEARKDGKKGMIIYFGRKDCAYCKALLEGSWGDPTIREYTQKNFNVIAIDVRGARAVIDFNQRKWTEKTYATHRRMNFTPTLLFYTTSGQLALKLPGYRPKYQFRAALEYVADAHYLQESYRQYLARAESALSYGLEELNENELFTQDSTDLSRLGKSKPLLVLFEHPRCHACDVLHGDTLDQIEVVDQLRNIDRVQINTYKDRDIITPAGKKTTTRQWADELNLTFAPSLVFFDTNGKEILRIESVVRFYRLSKVLHYISSKAYLEYPTFQNWLQHTAKSEPAK